MRDNTFTQDSDNLLLRAAKGDTSAFSELVRLLEDSVYRLAYTLVGNRQDAEDVTQETFLRLWRSLGTYRGESSVRIYVFRITQNAAYDLLRKRKRRRMESLDTSPDPEEPVPELADPDPYANPAEEYMRRERIRSVRNAISRLPDEQRLILSLRDLEGCTYEEISALLHLPEGTVKSRLFRAREALKKLLKYQKI